MEVRDEGVYWNMKRIAMECVTWNARVVSSGSYSQSSAPGMRKKGSLLEHGRKGDEMVQ